jgi:hypothetical protein
MFLPSGRFFAQENRIAPQGAKLAQQEREDDNE